MPPAGGHERSDRFAHVDRDRDVPMRVLLALFAELHPAKLGRRREPVTDVDLDASVANLASAT